MHLLAQALAGKCHSRWFPPWLLAVDAHQRTVPHLRSALNPLPAACGVDTASA